MDDSKLAVIHKTADKIIQYLEPFTENDKIISSDDLEFFIDALKVNTANLHNGTIHDKSFLNQITLSIILLSSACQGSFVRDELDDIEKLNMNIRRGRNININVMRPVFTKHDRDCLWTIGRILCLIDGMPNELVIRAEIDNNIDEFEKFCRMAKCYELLNGVDNYKELLVYNQTYFDICVILACELLPQSAGIYFIDILVLLTFRCIVIDRPEISIHIKDNHTSLLNLINSGVNTTVSITGQSENIDESVGGAFALSKSSAKKGNLTVSAHAFDGDAIVHLQDFPDINIILNDQYISCLQKTEDHEDDVVEYYLATKFDDLIFEHDKMSDMIKSNDESLTKINFIDHHDHIMNIMRMSCKCSFGSQVNMLGHSKSISIRDRCISINAAGCISSPNMICSTGIISLSSIIPLGISSNTEFERVSRSIIHIIEKNSFMLQLLLRSRILDMNFIGISDIIRINTLNKMPMCISLVGLDLMHLLSCYEMSADFVEVIDKFVDDARTSVKVNTRSNREIIHNASEKKLNGSSQLPVEYSMMQVGYNISPFMSTLLGIGLSVVGLPLIHDYTAVKSIYPGAAMIKFIFSSSNQIDINELMSALSSDIECHDKISGRIKEAIDVFRELSSHDIDEHLIKIRNVSDHPFSVVMPEKNNINLIHNHSLGLSCLGVVIGDNNMTSVKYSHDILNY